jgi:hypothetical protein
MGGGPIKKPFEPAKFSANLAWQMIPRTSSAVALPLDGEFSLIYLVIHFTLFPVGMWNIWEI